MKSAGYTNPALMLGLAMAASALLPGVISLPGASLGQGHVGVTSLTNASLDQGHVGVEDAGRAWAARPVGVGDLWAQAMTALREHVMQVRTL